jgi:hypothetical protein
MIENPHPSTVNLCVGLFPYLMGTFDYPSPSNDVKFNLDVPHQLKAVIFQIVSLRTSYFNKLWILPSPSNSMEGIGNPIMDIPLSIVEDI